MYTQEFVNLVMGDRSMYPIPFDMNGGGASIDTEAKQLLDHGYVVSNLLDLKSLTAEQMADFYTSFKPEFKEGYILRKGFADRKKFREYSEEEWRVIFAQYSLTYGWSGEYQGMFGSAAADVIEAYNDDEVSVVDQIMTGAKVIKVGFRKDTVNLIKEILESKVVLRTHQKKTLEACPTDVLAEAYRKSKITIRETMIQAIVLLKDSNEVVEKVFNSPTDVLRFILAKFAHKPFEGQITKPDLTDRKVKIPTSYRKWLMMELDNMGSAHRICEDMFKYESYWKLMHRYLRYGKAATARKRFERYHAAIDLLFDGDRSWTFNGRYSAAIADGKYYVACNIAQERPGFLFRNMLNFLRYPVGTKIAQTAGAKTVSLDPMSKGNTKTVQSDDIAYFTSSEFIRMVQVKANPKLAWQLLEQLKGPAIFAPQTSRVVQGITKRYSTPIPGIKKGLAKKVRKTVEAGIHLMLAERNKDVGMVYIDKSLKDTSIQYSGRNSTETNYSGTFLSPGSKIDIPDERILRMGVLWRGNRSTDIDHNCGVYEGNQRIRDVYFGQPTYGDLVNSSGDITSCSKENFSVEFIDIDLEKVRETNITSLVTSMISYSGNPISDCETYLFVKGLSRSDRKIKGRSIKMDLMDTDYAIRIDPDKQENSTGYIGFNTTILDNKIQVCAYTDPKDSGVRYSTIREKNFSPEFLDGLFGNQTSLYKTLKMAFTPEQITTDPKFADVIFGEGGLNPATDLEAINKFIL
jgi:hypothetical protein